MARYARVSQWQVRQVWQAADVKPHRLKTFKLSHDPQFAEKVIDVVALYLNPPDNALVLSVDGKTQIQALGRTHPMLPLRPGQVERRTMQPIPAFTCTSRRPVPRGSTRSRVGAVSWSGAPCGGASSPV